MSKLRTNSTVSEVDGAALTLVTSLKDAAIAGDAHLAALQTELTNLSAQLNEAVKRDRALSVLDVKDGNRDDSVMALFGIVRGYALSRTFGADAETVLRVLDKYKGLSSKSYEVETSLVESLYTDLTAQPEAAAELTKLPGLNEILAEVRTAQDQFHAEFASYKATLANQEKGFSAGILKKQMLDFVNNHLTVYLDGMELADPAKYSGLNNTIRKVIDDNNALVVRRSKKNPA